MDKYICIAWYVDGSGKPIVEITDVIAIMANFIAIQSAAGMHVTVYVITNDVPVLLTGYELRPDFISKED